MRVNIAMSTLVLRKCGGVYCSECALIHSQLHGVPMVKAQCCWEASLTVLHCTPTCVQRCVSSSLFQVYVHVHQGLGRQMCTCMSIGRHMLVMGAAVLYNSYESRSHLIPWAKQHGDTSNWDALLRSMEL